MSQPLIADRQLLHSLHQHLCTMEYFDQEAIRLQRTGMLGTYPSTQGQEAVFLGAAASLEANDRYIPYYRDTAALHWRGVDLYDILRFWGGYDDGMAYPNNPHDYPICIPISTQITYAVGTAYALKYQQKPQIALVTMGDGATNKGQFYESTQMALTQQLPLLFLINKNQWAISTPLNQQSSQTPFEKIVGLGMPSENVDGYQLMDVLQAVQRGRQHILTHGGPYCVHATTYRTCDHTTADDAAKYQPHDERSHYLSVNTKQLFEDQLLRQGSISVTDINTHHHSARSTVDQAIQTYIHKIQQTT